MEFPGTQSVRDRDAAASLIHCRPRVSRSQSDLSRSRRQWLPKFAIIFLLRIGFRSCVQGFALFSPS